MYDQNNLPSAKLLKTLGVATGAEQMGEFHGTVYLLQGQFFGVGHKSKVLWLGYHE